MNGIENAINRSGSASALGALIGVSKWLFRSGAVKGACGSRPANLWGYWSNSTRTTARSLSKQY